MQRFYSSSFVSFYSRSSTEKCGGHVCKKNCVLHHIVLALAMTLTSTADSLSIFEDGKLKPGIYKIQNIVAKTFLDCEEHTREMCCRPANELSEGKGLVS